MDAQLALEVGESGPVVVSGPWVTRCGDPGPYAINRPTPKSPNRLEVLTCTRPAEHDHRTHIAAAPDGRILAVWDPSGHPVYPIARPVRSA